MNSTWMVAPSYQHASILEIDETNKKAYIAQTCDRCGGRGYFAVGTLNGQPVLSPVDGGVCYKCGGDKKIFKWVKAYTEKEYAKYLATVERSRERKAESIKKAREELENASEDNMKAALAELGYDVNDPKVYLVASFVKSTYDIKDSLKEQGCKFNPVLNWYNTHPIDIPEDFFLVDIDVFTLFDWNCYTKRFELKDTAKDTVKQIIKEKMPKSEFESEFVGELKERLRDIEATVVRIKNFSSCYGTSTIYTFESNHNIFVWITSSCKYQIQSGDKVLLTGTVKDHKEYEGVKQTHLSRCILK